MGRRVLALAAAMMLGTTGCATIVKGGRQDVTISSPTPDAEVSIRSFKGREVFNGPLPATVRLQREDQYTLTVSAPGHKEQKATITKSMSGWAFGNLIWIIPILWGVGIGIDAASGALWSLDPDQMTIRLVRAHAAPAAGVTTRPDAPTPPGAAPASLPDQPE